MAVTLEKDRGVLVTHDYNKSKTMKNNDNVEGNFEKSKSNFMKIFRNLPVFHIDY